MSDINWDEAPEGATHYCPKNSNFSAVWVKDISDIGYKYIRADERGQHIWGFEDLTMKGELYGIVEKPVKPVTLSPIYTQEMADNGELPLVGMECMVFNGELMNAEYEKCTIDFIGCHVIVYSSESCTERTCNLELVKFKAITPPIKLLDGKAYQFDTVDGVTWVGFYRDHNDCFYDTKCFSETISESKNCTNIQLLEVK